MTRTEIRETVFKVLFRYEFHDPESFVTQMSMFFAQYPESGDDESEDWPELKDKDVVKITDKVTDILCKLSEIDSKIEEKLDNWKFERIGKAELSIMRIAVYEILFDDTIDTAVAISEAVKMSKKYCDDKSHSFVNGVLAKFVD